MTNFKKLAQWLAEHAKTLEFYEELIKEDFIGIVETKEPEKEEIIVINNGVKEYPTTNFVEDWMIEKLDKKLGLS